MGEKAKGGFAAQLPKNLVANLGYFGLNIIIGIALVPYFISTLGIAAYGLIPIATALTGYVAILVQSLNTAVSRHLTVDIQRGDYETANRTFNTAIISLSIIILLMVPVVLVVAYFVPVIFNIPAGYETDSIILFLLVCFAFMIRSWSGNFTVQLFAYNRLDLQNWVNTINLVVQTGIIVIFFTVFGPNLALVGMAYLIGAIVASIVSISLAKRVCPNLRINLKSFDRYRLNDITGMGWWLIINNIGSLLFLQIDLIVVNMLFGATMSGEYAVVLQWVILLRSIAGVLSGILTPMVLGYYAKNQTDTLIKVSVSAVKIMGLAMALPIGLVCGFAPQLLHVWLGEKFVFLAPLMIILTIHLTINLAVLPLFSINVAYNKMKVPGVLTLIMGFGNITLAIALSLLTGWGFYGVAIAGAIVLTSKNAIFTPWYAAKILGIHTNTFLKGMWPGIVATIFVSVIGYICGNFFQLTTIPSLIVVGGVICMICFIGIWQFGFSTFERGLFVSYLPKTIRMVIT